MKIPRRNIFKGLAASLGWMAMGKAAGAADVRLAKPPAVSRGNGPDPLYVKPMPVTMAELKARKAPGASVAEVSDYLPVGYSGPLTPCPPHADMNPHHAAIVTWEGKPHRFIFSHEASYVPAMELPNGVGLCNQFFEGNTGDELFNDLGRRTRNSFVNILQSGPERAWVRWNYFCVNKDDDTRIALKGTEDYIAYPNGLMWRRLTYETMMPDSPEGYSWQPIDFFAWVPNGTEWKDILNRDEEHGDYHVATVVDAFSDKRYDKFWDDNGKARRIGDAALLLEISHSRGLAMILPTKAGNLFTILGEASGFPSAKSQVVDHSFNDTGGWGWGPIRWDHWPVGWLNSEGNNYKPGVSKYPYHYGPLSHYIVSHPLKNCGEFPMEDANNDYHKETLNMEHNRWAERHVYYTLTGAAIDAGMVAHDHGLARQEKHPCRCHDATSSALEPRWPPPR